MDALWIHQTTREIVLGTYFSEKPLGFIYRRVDTWASLLAGREILSEQWISRSNGEWDYWAEFY